MDESVFFKKTLFSGVMTVPMDVVARAPIITLIHQNEIFTSLKTDHIFIIRLTIEHHGLTFTFDDAKLNIVNFISSQPSDALLL